MIVYENKIASSFQAVDDTVHAIVDTLRERCGVSDKHVIFKVGFMLREVMNNAVEHGNHFDESKWVACVVSFLGRYLLFEVRDEGEGIPLSLLNPLSGDELLLRERQRGYETIRDMAFSIEIIGNAVYVKLDLNQEDNHE